MTYNSIGYLFFFSIMFYVIGVVGWQFYSNGKYYLQSIFKADPHLVDSINKMMLIGYYLFNLGYVAISIHGWEQIYTLTDLIGIVAEKSGAIILILGVMHYLNLFWMSHFYKIKKFLKTI